MFTTIPVDELNRHTSTGHEEKSGFTASVPMNMDSPETRDVMPHLVNERKIAGQSHRARCPPFWY